MTTHKELEVLQAEVQAQQSLAVEPLFQAARQEIISMDKLMILAQLSGITGDAVGAGMASESKAQGHEPPGCPLATDCGPLRAVVSPLVLSILDTELAFPPRPACLTQNRVKITMPNPSL